MGMRPIDADVLMEQMKRRKDFVGRPSDPVCLVEDAPTIDAVPVWVSVKDRMPEENVPVLVWELQGFAYVDVYKDGAWEVGTPNLAKFTHWMPLPEPPKEVSE